MTTERDPRTRIVLSWLREDAHEDAERVLLNALNEVDTTPQRRSSWSARRMLQMNVSLRAAVAAAAVLVVVVIGLRFLPSSSIGPAPSPTATVAPTPLATATLEPTRPLPAADVPLTPGRYSVAIPGSSVLASLTVGSGWTSGGWFVHNPAGSISFWIVSNVPTDACNPFGSLPDPPTGPTGDDFVAALGAQANSDMSAPQAVEIGGYVGQRVGLKPSRVASDECQDLMWWMGVDGAQGRGAPGDELRSDAVLVLDVEGQRVVIVDFPAAQLGTGANMEILDSISFVAP